MPQERLPKQPQQSNSLATKPKQQQKLLDRKLLLPPFRSLELEQPGCRRRNTSSNLLYLRKSHLGEEPSCFWETQSLLLTMCSACCAQSNEECQQDPFCVWLSNGAAIRAVCPAACAKERRTYHKDSNSFTTRERKNIRAATLGQAKGPSSSCLQQWAKGKCLGKSMSTG